MFDVRIITEVATELLSVADIKEHMRITFTDDDTYLASLIKSARKAIEKYCVISLGTQEIEIVYDGEAWVEMELPYAPVITINSVEYKADYGTYSAMTVSEEYDVDGGLFKTITPFSSNRFKVNYDAGYTVLPEDLKMYWLRLCTFYYENRGDMGKIPEDLKRDLNTHKRLAWL